MTEEDKARKIAIMDAARGRIEAARSTVHPDDEVYSEFRPGFFADRDVAWINAFHEVQRRHKDDVDAWAQAFLDFHPMPHQRTREAIIAWADQLPWPDDREGMEKARIGVRMSIAMRMSYTVEPQKTYSFLEFAKLLNVKEHAIWHIIDVGDIRPHAIVGDYQQKSLAEVIDSLRFSESDIDVFRQEFRRRRHEEFRIEYSDVYKPDEGPAARGLEFGPGWTGIVSEFCDQLRLWKADGWPIHLRWGKEKFGALRLFTDTFHVTSTPLQSYWLSRLRERARRQSLRICQECGQPGRLRLGAHAATLCDRHKHIVGELRPDDDIILDPDRTDEHDQPKWTDGELGLDEGTSMDMAKQMQIDFTPYLDPDLVLDGTDEELADLRRKLIAVDRAIGRHHEIKLRKRQRGYEIAVEHPRSMSTVDEVKRDAIIAEIELIMSGEQS
ncbi:hypothetical protein [Rhizobium sp. Root482]|uniref:hypothetical protein n=1 Tax=Rhizobium sp. Root482 TaxID=1736543 RepID=UPI0006F4FB1F|nr:hypothetical protein [Rhizobium sp. Root482]KQY20055.1 hypothetical protein ASD31_06690 [Rhizobium sp. Root482]